MIQQLQIDRKMYLLLLMVGGLNPFRIKVQHQQTSSDDNDIGTLAMLLRTGE